MLCFRRWANISRKEETVMDSITLRNFRCFREEQTARLAPLTLLVGENSTGKTSFMAMIRALWDVCYRAQVPISKRNPTIWEEIAHYRGGKGGRAKSFEAGFDFNYVKGAFHFSGDGRCRTAILSLRCGFRKEWERAALRKMRLTRDDVWYEAHYQDQSQEIRFGTPRGAWVFQLPRIGVRYLA